MKLKQYPKYKESGVEWIGKIPENWEVRKIKNIGFVATSSVDKKIESNQPLVNLVNYMDVYKSKDKRISNNLSFMKVSARPEQILSSNVKKGDVLFNPSSEEESDIGHSAVVVDELKNTLYSYHLVRLRFNKSLDLNLEYKRYVFNNHFVLNQASYQCKGTTRAILSLSDIKEFQFILPPIEIQPKIVSFLDIKISKIDSFISKDQRLIELLKEKRIALINHVVIKGLNSKAKLKDSGIEWIGKIPENWEVNKLKFVSIINNKSLSDATPLNYKLSYVDISNVDSNGYILNYEELYFEDAPSRARKIPEKGNTILSTVRTYLKAIAYLDNIPNNTIVSTGFAVLKPLKEINSKYLFYSVRSEFFIQSVIAESTGVAYPAINPFELSQIKLVIPPKSEQIQIAEYLDKETMRIDQTIEKIEKKIELLEEFKKSLIHHVVTGKVDVRGIYA